MRFNRIFRSEKSIGILLLGLLAALFLLQLFTSPAVQAWGVVIALAGLGSVAWLASLLNRKAWQPARDLANRLQALHSEAKPDHTEAAHSLREELDWQVAALEKRLATSVELVQYMQQGGDGVHAQLAPHQQANDPLTLALLDLNQQLRSMAEKEKQRLWVSEGLARFAEILRTNHAQPEEVYDQVLATLVKYLGANQGILFVREEEDGTPWLQSVACYAYQRKKYLQQRIAVSQGLVGQCYLEKDTILLTEIPQEYVRITSGLGEANPDCILIVPLQYNQEVVGVIELAAFRKFERYQVEFVEKLAENIAATIASLKVVRVTSKLLADSQSKANQLLEQESIMRQNMEEMEATQEEMRRTQIQLQHQEESHRNKVIELTRIREELEAQLKQQLQEVNGQKTRIETFLKGSLDTILFMDQHGTITEANQGAEKMFGYKATELVGKSIDTLVPVPEKNFLETYCTQAGKQMGIPLEFSGKSKMYGFIFPVEVSLNKATWNGEVLYTATIRNITKRKEQEETMKKSLRNFQELTDSVHKKDLEIKELKAQLEQK